MGVSSSTFLKSSKNNDCYSINLVGWAEGARLESLCTVKGTVGSNPTLSAINLIFKKNTL